MTEPRNRHTRAERATIEALRGRIEERKAHEPARPTLEQVQMLVSDIRQGISLTDTGAAINPAQPVQGERLVLDVLAKLGPWLAHSIGRAEATWRYAADVEQPTLFTATPADGAVIIPDGYEPTGPHRRDLDKAIAAVVIHKPSEDILERFVDRTYATRQSIMNYPLVAGVWGFAQQGRLGTLDAVSDDLLFQTQAVDAYDLLDVGREDAIKAITRLLTAENLTAKKLLGLCDRAYWLDEAGFQSLRRAASAALGDKSRSDFMLRELATMRRRIESQHARYFPENVADLTLGQVRRISENAGIRVEPENRVEETAIRRTLKSMGFSTDLDRLLPEALRCAETGTLEEFWDIMQSRKDGSRDWSARLEQLSNAS